MTDLQLSPAHPGFGRLRAEIANALVRFYKEYYGRGPTTARAFIEDQFIFVVLENGFTRSELTLIEAGEHELVATCRQHFRAATDDTLREIMEALTGRRVMSHHSQVGFEPPRTFDIFVLDAPIDQASSGSSS